MNEANQEYMVNGLKAPWLKNYGDVPHTLTYPDCTMVELIEEAAQKYPKYCAYEFMGTKRNYSQFISEIILCAKSLRAIGIRKNDVVTVAMPNCPQGIIVFYAINMIGAVGNMIHPLSSEGEIAFYLSDSKSVCAITLDQFYGKFEAIKTKVKLKNLIITSIKDALNPVMKLGYEVTQGRKVQKLPKNADVYRWNDFLDEGRRFIGQFRAKQKTDDLAVILYSGGTTGTTKGILLSNRNFNALALQVAAMSNVIVPGNSMLAVMPIFHGFGLGISIHTVLAHGCKAILLPRLVLAEYAKALKRKKPNYIAGVPTLFEALLRLDGMKNADLSCLRGVFSGGDTLSAELKKKVDTFLKEHKSPVEVREGYGLTECVTASAIAPYHIPKGGSIGFPLPDTYYKICKVGTTEEVPYGTEGEICLTGPTLMIGYNNQPEETKNTLRKHPDGFTWLHTGDLGRMDEEGFLYFSQRIKRMIISSGYNIYPSQLENVIDSHEAVLMSCCIGIPDPYKVEVVKAFVMLKPVYEDTKAVKESIFELCRKNIAKYALPVDIEIRDEMPKTLVGKVAYRILEEEEARARSAR
ncbi:MAG: long-chain fatty acid--CoA ligase [Clostridiales bacterium]|nr:long-chain fatty acid--CoA ligase [Clostridiales bacterium]